MRTSTRNKSFAAAIVAAFVLSACSDSGVKETPAPSGASTDVIELGFIGSFTGQGSDTAREVRLGAELAVSQLNALGGLLKKQIRLKVVDDEGKPDLAVTKMDELIGQNVTLGIGPTASATTGALREKARQDAMLFISPSASSPELDLEDAELNFNPDIPLPANILRSVPSDRLQSSALVTVARQDKELFPEDPSLKSGVRRCTEVVLIYQKDSYGEPIFKRTEDAARDNNLPITKRIEINPTDAEAQLREAAESVVQFAGENDAANCQVIIAQPRTAGSYMLAFRDVTKDNTARDDVGGWSAFTTIGSDGFTQDAFVTAGRANAADPNSATAGNGSVAVAANTRDQNSQAFNNFREAFRARNPGVEPGQYSTTAYDAIIMLALAVEKTQTTTDRPLLRKTLFELSVGEPLNPNDLPRLLSTVRAPGSQVNYEGVSGSMDFQSSGAVDGNFVVGRINENRFNALGTLKSSSLQ